MAALEVVHQTWFGSNDEYVSGINMLPFTPISEDLLPYDFMAQLWPVLKKALDRYVYDLFAHDATIFTCTYTYCVFVLLSLFCNHHNINFSLICHLARADDPPVPQWAGYLYLGRAILEPEEARDSILTLDIYDSANVIVESLTHVSNYSSTLMMHSLPPPALSRIPHS